MRNWTQCLMLTLVVLGCSAALWAADPKTEQAQEAAAVALATARAKAEAALRLARQAADDNRSGWTVAWQTADLTRSKIAAVLQGRYHVEERKDDGNRDHDLMDLLRQRMEHLQEAWDTYNVKDRTPLMISYRDAAENVQRLNQVLDSLANSERAWKDANLEPAILQAAYEAVGGKLTAARQQAERALNGLLEKQKMWDTELDAATKFVASDGKKP